MSMVMVTNGECSPVNYGEKYRKRSHTASVMLVRPRGICYPPEFFPIPGYLEPGKNASRANRVMEKKVIKVGRVISPAPMKRL